MNAQPFTIKIRMDNNEIELSGSWEDVLKTLNDLQRIVNKVSEAFEGPMASINHGIQKGTQGLKFPVITMASDAQCPEAIVKILSTEWGRNEPRRLGELFEAMKVNAIHYPKGTVKGRLTDLTKKGILRRIKTGRGYGYILARLE